MLVEGDIKKEHDLFIKSEGWLGTIDYDPVPKYYSEAQIINDHSLMMPQTALNEIKLNEKPLVSSFHFVMDFEEASADNFVLNTTFRNIYNDKWAVCETTRLVVLGTKGAIVIPFSIPGCISELGLLLNDTYVNGKENDLSAFGVNLSDFKNIELSVRNKNVKVSIEDEIIYIGHYNYSVGSLVGFRFRFLGAGEVDYLKLSDLDGRIIIDDDFYINQ